MDTYFQAAVVDLDKLLDDFEHSTDELETYPSRDAPLNPNQSAFLSGDFYLQPDLPSPRKPSYGSSPEEPPSPVRLNNEEFKNVTPVSQGERNVTGPDLLSCVEEVKSNENESSTGRSSVPICDLISDTGSLLHTASSNESLIPDTLQPGASAVSDLALLSDPAFFTAPAPDLSISLGNEELHSAEVSTRESDMLPDTGSNLLDLSPEASSANINITSDVTGNMDDAREASDIASSIDSSSTSSSSSTDGYVSDDMCYEALPEDQTGLQSKVHDVELDSALRPTSLDVLMLSTENADLGLGSEIYSNLGACQNECLSLEKHEIGSVITSECSDGVSKASTPLAHIEQAPHNESPPCAEEDCTTQDRDLTMKDNSVEIDNQASGENQAQNDSQNDLEVPIYKDASLQPTPLLSVPTEKCLAKENKSADKDFPPQPVTELPVVEESMNITPILARPDNIYSPDFENAILSDFISDHNDLLLGDAYITDEELNAFLREEGVPLDKEGTLENLAVCDAPRVDSSGTGAVSDDLQSQEIDQGKAQSNTGVVSKNPPASYTPNQENLTGATVVSHIGGARPKQLFNQPPKSLNLSQHDKLNNRILERTLSDQMPEESGSNSLHSPNVLHGSVNEDTDDSPELCVREAMQRPDNMALENPVLGQKHPIWIPDSEAPNCMNCSTRFTFTKRRHHCRACGKVFCAVCCSQKCRLQYLDKEARVCVVCYDFITKVQAIKRRMSPTAPSPNPTAPPEYCSTIPPLVQAQAAGMNPKEQKRVWFADGLLPNGEVADTSKLAAVGRKTPQDSSPVSPISPDAAMAVGSFQDNSKQSDNTEKPEILHEASKAQVSAAEDTTSTFKVSSASDYTMLCCIEKSVSRELCLIPDDEMGLPPLLMTIGASEDAVVENRPTHAGVMLLLEEDGTNPITFILNANLLVNVKLVTYASEKCWFFATNGLHSLGQAEIVVMLNCLPNEDTVPKDVFKLMLNIYKDAQKGIV